MSAYTAAPAFGKPKKTDAYYSTVRTFIHALRGTMTYAGIAIQLNRSGFRTPMELPFDKQGVQNILRNA